MASPSLCLYISRLALDILNTFYNGFMVQCVKIMQSTFLRSVFYTVFVLAQLNILMRIVDIFVWLLFWCQRITCLGRFTRYRHRWDGTHCTARVSTVIESVGLCQKSQRFSAAWKLGLTWLDLIHPTSTWTYWTTLRRHSCLLRAATSASSQVSPIPRRSFLTIPLQFVLGRRGPLLKPGASQYSAWCVMGWRR